MSYFEVEFRIRLFRFVALFDFSNFYLKSSSNSTSRISCRISCRISNSSFRVEFRIRLFRFVALFDFSNFNFRFEVVVEIFDVLLYSTSRISLLYSTSRNRSSNSISRISSSRFKCLEFRIRLDLFDFSNCRRNLCCSIRLLEVAFFI